METWIQRGDSDPRRVEVFPFGITFRLDAHFLQTLPSHALVGILWMGQSDSNGGSFDSCLNRFIFYFTSLNLVLYTKY